MIQKLSEMPTPIPTTPAPTASQPANTGFFIPQSSTAPTPVKNLSESPVLSSPTSQGQSGKVNNATPSSPRKKIMIGLGIVLVILLLLGGAAGLYLSRTSEDTRQQASTPSGSAQISLSPAAGTFEGGSAQEIAFNLNLTTTPVTLSAIELSVAFSGEVPTDLSFQPELLQNFQPANTSVTDSEAGKTLKIIFQPVSTQGFSATTNKISLGTLKFTTPQTGEVNLRFNASESKVVLQQSNVDILRPPSLIAYSFQSPATPTPDPLLENQLTSEATASGNAIATESADINPPPELAEVGGAAPSATPALLAQLNTTTTPTLTPTRTPTLTPSPTTTRESSLPADTQETPVSGSMDLTVTLFGSGSLLTAVGFFLLRRKPKLSK